jgi:hypothetical protein
MATDNEAATELGQLVPARHEIIRLSYIQWKDEFNVEKPYEVISQAPEGFPKSNFSVDFGPEEIIHDVRGQETKFNIDDHAFEIRMHSLTLSSLDKETIEQEYLTSVKSLLEMIDPGAEVYIFDWRVWDKD